MNRIIVLISLVFFVASCKHETLIEPKPEKIDCSNGEIDFVNQVLPLLQTGCATSGCHDASTAKDGVVLDSYTNIIATGDVNAGNANSSELYEVLNEDLLDIMPPANSGIVFTKAQKDLIKNWINEGAKNVECETIVTVPSCDSINVSFKNSIVPILDASCVSCHTGSTAEGGVWLDNYADVKIVALDSSLLSSIKHSVGFEPMPEGGGKLDDCKIAKIENWIAEGALNN